MLRHIPTWTAVRQALAKSRFSKGSSSPFGDMVVEAVDTLTHGYDEGMGRPASGRPATKKNAEALVWEWIEGRYEDFVAAAADFTDPLVIFREVNAPTFDAIRLRPRLDGGLSEGASRAAWSEGAKRRVNPGLGVWWSYQPEAAEAHWAPSDSGPAQDWLVIGEVAASDVDWLETLSAACEAPYEREVTLKRGAPVRVIRIRSDEGVVAEDLWGSA